MRLNCQTETNWTQIEERLDSRFIPNYGGGLPEGKDDCTGAPVGVPTTERT